MDLQETIRQLVLDKERIERAIAELDQLNADGGCGGAVQKRRGRKSMHLSERREVSERMKRYWANRRRHQAG